MSSYSKGFNVLEKINSKFTNEIKVNDVPLKIKYICFYIDSSFNDKDVLGILIWYDSKTLTKRSNLLHNLVDPIRSEYNIEIFIYQHNLETFLEYIFLAFIKTYIIGLAPTYNEYLNNNTSYLKKYL